MNTRTDFYRFVTGQHRGLLLAAVVLLVLHALIIKALFPHAIIAPDSNQYIRTALHKVELWAWPIGYPILLGWLHQVAKGDWIVFLFQYIALETAILYFYFSIRYLFNPGRWLSYLILFMLLMNPFFLLMSNYVLTDSVFATLTVCWFTLTLWYFYRPRPVYAFLLVILFFLSFTIRYSAAFYPLISLPVLLFGRLRWQVKVAAVGLTCLLFWGFIRYTEGLYKELMGRQDFSPFSGWQLCANSLIMYRHIDHREADIPPAGLRELHRNVVTFLNHMWSPEMLPDHILTHYFDWNAGSPLVRYSHATFGLNPKRDDLRKWAIVGGLYRQYGNYLIRQHPAAFARYYLGDALIWFVDPRDAFTNVYPEGGYEVTDTTKNWFGYPSNWVSCTRSPVCSVTYFPTIFNILNFLFLVGFAGYYVCRNYKKEPPFINRSVAFAGIFWLTNILFILVSAPFQIRYGLCGMIFNIGMVPMLIEKIIRA